MKTLSLACVAAFAFAVGLQAKEFHVAINGSNTNPGTKESPFRTIQHAADVALPGDTITVHAGVYRERVNPPRGGTSDRKRITYQAAPDEMVVITGSEPMKGWVRVTNDTWKVTMPNSYFGSFNPYSDIIHGDWCSNPHGYHTGAIYLNGDWLTEAAGLDAVLQPVENTPRWFGRVTLNWTTVPVVVGRQEDLEAPDSWPLRDGAAELTHFTDHGSPAIRVALAGTTNAPMGSRFIHKDEINLDQQPVMAFQLKTTTQEAVALMFQIDGNDNWFEVDIVGTQNYQQTGRINPAVEINDGQWHQVVLDLRKLVALRIDPKFKSIHNLMIGTWANPREPVVVEFKDVCFGSLGEPLAESDHDDPVMVEFKGESTNCTTIWAQFPGINPNDANAEINVRQTVFTPSRTGINYLTVRGFTLCDAAAMWAPPTAAQIGIISAYWCKGWIIESNHVCYSPCCGIALGKYGDEWDNKSANSADGYVDTIHRALTNGWNKATVGSHLVRNNTIAHCEQTGIVGSLGCSFSTITGNEIHDIHVRNLYDGAEMAGIKFHGAIDVTISHNHIYKTCDAIWLDWMGQGSQITANLIHGGGLFLEMQHGPILVANNLFLSGDPIAVNSQGIAFVHNLMTNTLSSCPGDTRVTPFHGPHTTMLAGMYPAADGESGDDRFYNNLVVGPSSLQAFDNCVLPCFAAGNVLVKGAHPSKFDTDALIEPDFDPGLKLTQKSDGWYLEITEAPAWRDGQKRQLVTTALLGKTKVSHCVYDNGDGSPVNIDTDYFGKKRDKKNPFPGPFENALKGEEVKVWPVSSRP